MKHKRLPRIAAVASRGLADLVQGQIALLAARAEVQLLACSAEEALPPLREWQQAGQLDAVVAAGQGAALLRSRLSVPVAAIRVGGDDILRALVLARRQSPRVALLARQKLAELVEPLRGVLNLELTPLIYDSDADARRHLDALAQAARPVVVGSSQIVHLASQYGLNAVLVYSPEAVLAAFDAALELVRVAQQEEAKRERLDRMLESLAEGVVVVDAEERIQAINPALSSLLGTTAARAVGKVLSDLAPDLSLAQVLKSGKARRDMVLSMAGRRLVSQHLPLFESGTQVGAVLTLQESAAIEHAERKLRAEAGKHAFRARYRLGDIVGEAPMLREALDMAMLYAGTDSAVLIQGESGTGKELFAQGIHLASHRANGPFVALNCAAFPENLLESELFGYEEGAFTGSRRGGKNGLIELADRGTLFLDEVGDMPLALQTRLLRVLQEKEVLRLGAAEPVPVDVRVIAASHMPLKQMADTGQFRTDLYFRLAILTLALPPLRERPGDVALLAGQLAREALARLACTVPPEQLVTPLLAAAAGYGWPGNVRELQSLVERLAVFLRARQQLSTAVVYRLAPELRGDAPSLPLVQQAALDRRAHAAQVLQRCGGDRRRAAAELGISRTTLWRLLNVANS
ncbi:propionate catabolism operon regulatory protein PrpR [Chitinimonas sp.]|uniref:propionate catabolism operon regulatory protein PrpR n=1 Tax=Chitinimonas sp. TaxID=1934313 RepID=UPI0035B0A412